MQIKKQITTFWSTRQRTSGKKQNSTWSQRWRILSTDPSSAQQAVGQAEKLKTSPFLNLWTKCIKCAPWAHYWQHIWPVTTWTRKGCLYSQGQRLCMINRKFLWGIIWLRRLLICWHIRWQSSWGTKLCLLYYLIRLTPQTTEKQCQTQIFQNGKTLTKSPQSSKCGPREKTCPFLAPS